MASGARSAKGYTRALGKPYSVHEEHTTAVDRDAEEGTHARASEFNGGAGRELP